MYINFIELNEFHSWVSMLLHLAMIFLLYIPHDLIYTYFLLILVEHIPTSIKGFVAELHQTLWPAPLNASLVKRWSFGSWLPRVLLLSFPSGVVGSCKAQEEKERKTTGDPKPLWHLEEKCSQWDLYDSTPSFCTHV